MKTQMSLCILVRSESSQVRFWIAKNAQFLHEDNKDSDQTGDVQDDLNLD